MENEVAIIEESHGSKSAFTIVCEPLSNTDMPLYKFKININSSYPSLDHSSLLPRFNQLFTLSESLCWADTFRDEADPFDELSSQESELVISAIEEAESQF